MSDRRPATAVPRWVWISALGMAALILTAAVIVLLRPEQHGPEQHGPGDDPASHGDHSHEDHK